jgi:hypothetical protein
MERTRSFLSVNSSLMMRFATAPPSIAMIMRRASSSSSLRLAYFWLSASRKVCTVSTGSGASAMRLLRHVGSSSSHRRLVLMLLLRLLFFFGSWTAAAAADSANPKHTTEDDKEAVVIWPEPLAEALDQLTVCQSGASAPSHMETARRRFASLLRRQRLPMDAASVRALSDVEVSRLLLMAAVGGMDTSWRRSPASSSAEEETPSKWLIDAHGRLIPAFAPNQVESDVLLCIICALLGALALPRGAL